VKNTAHARYLAVAESLFVTLILGSTLVLSKIALYHLGPLTIAGLRYLLAFLLLIPFLLRRKKPAKWSPQTWTELLIIGLSFYVIGNGALYLGLNYIPATTASLLLSFVPVLVLAASILWLHEAPARSQAFGIILSLAGSVLFFLPGFQAGEPFGIAIVSVGLAGNAMFGVLGRKVILGRQVDTLSLTAIPLGVGGGILLPAALAIEGLPRLSITGLGIVFWLALMNTALVFWLYNHALRQLTAFEMSVMINLTPVATAAWAWLLLKENLGSIQILGMVTVIIGIGLVQWRSTARSSGPTAPGSSEKKIQID
jgi:drug/metabolite transporter (DMT)-like permease